MPVSSVRLGRERRHLDVHRTLRHPKNERALVGIACNNPLRVAVVDPLLRARRRRCSGRSGSPSRRARRRRAAGSCASPPTRCRSGCGSGRSSRADSRARRSAPRTSCRPAAAPRAAAPTTSPSCSADMPSAWPGFADVTAPARVGGRCVVVGAAQVLRRRLSRTPLGLVVVPDVRADERVLLAVAGVGDAPDEPRLEPLAVERELLEELRADRELPVVHVRRSRSSRPSGS